MKALLLVAVLASANPVMEMPDDAGGRIVLLDDIANCDYGWNRGETVNSANLVTSDFCWRLNRSNGVVQFDNGHSANIEEFNLLQNGVVWIREFIL